MINPLYISTISENSNTEFGLTVETDTTGWLNESKARIYTNANGSFALEKGTATSQVDGTGEPGVIKFQIHKVKSLM